MRTMNEEECRHSILLVLKNELQAYHVCYLLFMVDCKILVLIGWQNYGRMRSFYYLKEGN